MATNPNRKLSSVIEEAQAPSRRTRVSRNISEAEDQFAGIKENTFHQIVLGSAASPEEKMRSVAQALEFTEDRAKNRERIKEFDAFKEYLQSISEEMSKKRIQMTDTETYAELQNVYGEFNDDLNNFIETMKPLTDITDALYKLRQDGKTREALDQIKEDRVWEQEQLEKISIADNVIRDTNRKIRRLTEENAHLSQEKGFFGYGQIKPAALAQIAINEADIAALNKSLETGTAELVTLNTELDERKTLMADSFEVQQLRNLLDLSTEEHTERQAQLVEAALKFVTTGKERFGAIRSHLNLMSEQIEGLGDNNGTMVQIYAVMNEATKAAETVNQEKRSVIVAQPKPESLIEQMNQDNMKKDIEEHIGVLATTTVDTMQAFADLTTERVKIQNMDASTKKQSESARAMHSRGISAVASQLSTVLTAVNAAAINETQAMASNTLAMMTRVTNDVAQKEAIRIAIGRDDINNELEETLETLANFGDTQREATEITRDALERVRATMEEMERLAKDTGEATADFASVSADVVAGAKEPKKKDVAPASSFKI